MRALALAVLAVAALAACASGSASSSSDTSLTIKYFANGMVPRAEPAVWTLLCDPARGTLSRRDVACRRLAEVGVKPFAPIPPSTVCTQIYGGPQVARIVGSVAGKRVWVTFTRADGCHISRWDRLSPWLLPAGGVTQ